MSRLGWSRTAGRWRTGNTRRATLPRSKRPRLHALTQGLQNLALVSNAISRLLIYPSDLRYPITGGSDNPGPRLHRCRPHLQGEALDCAVVIRPYGTTEIAAALRRSPRRRAKCWRLSETRRELQSRAKGTWHGAGTLGLPGAPCGAGRCSPHHLTGRDDHPWGGGA